MMGMVMVAINMRKATKVGDPSMMSLLCNMFLKLCCHRVTVSPTLDMA